MNAFLTLIIKVPPVKFKLIFCTFLHSLRCHNTEIPASENDKIDKSTDEKENKENFELFDECLALDNLDVEIGVGIIILRRFRVQANGFKSEVGLGFVLDRLNGG